MGDRFRTSSDTEVLLAAYRNWGLECLGRLNGMFAFGLYDTRDRKLILARDRAGEKPLFYRTSDDRIAFASELKALMADPSLARIVDPMALQQYLAYGYVAGEACLLAGVRKLPAAHVATYDLDTGTLTLAEYWRLPEPGSTPADSPEALDAALEVVLRDSVRQRLVADVPVGILLSGGIASSLVTAMAAEVFGGYLHCSWLQRQDKLRRAVPHALRLRMGDAAARLLPAGFRGRNYILGLSRDLPGSIAQFNSYFDGALQRRLLAPLVMAGVLRGPPPEAYKTSLCRRGRTV